MSVEIVIFCDRCGAVGDGGKTAAAVRLQLRAHAWKRTRDGRDYCPSCEPPSPPTKESRPMPVRTEPPRATFDVVHVGPGLVVLRDTSRTHTHIHPPTITNDAEAVIAALHARYGLVGRRVLYYDSINNLSELRHDEVGGFVSFAAASALDLLPALARTAAAPACDVLTEREMRTVLAALQLWGMRKDFIERDAARGLVRKLEEEMATGNGQHPALTAEELDGLVDRLAGRTPTTSADVARGAWLPAAANHATPEARELARRVVAHLRMLPAGDPREEGVIERMGIAVDQFAASRARQVGGGE